MSATVRKDCKMYDARKNKCTGLKALYCAKYNECRFYKSKEEKKKDMTEEK